jgi:hypothetical protein
MPLKIVAPRSCKEALPSLENSNMNFIQHRQHGIVPMSVSTYKQSVHKKRTGRLVLYVWSVQREGEARMLSKERYMEKMEAEFKTTVEEEGGDLDMFDNDPCCRLDECFCEWELRWEEYMDINASVLKKKLKHVGSSMANVGYIFVEGDGCLQYFNWDPERHVKSPMRNVKRVIKHGYIQDWENYVIKEVLPKNLNEPMAINAVRCGEYFAAWVGVVAAMHMGRLLVVSERDELILDALLELREFARAIEEADMGTSSPATWPFDISTACNVKAELEPYTVECTETVGLMVKIIRGRHAFCARKRDRIWLRLVSAGLRTLEVLSECVVRRVLEFVVV